MRVFQVGSLVVVAGGGGGIGEMCRVQCFYRERERGREREGEEGREKREKI